MKKEGLSLNLLWLGIVVLATGFILGFLGAEYRFWSLLGMLAGAAMLLMYVVFNFTAVQDAAQAYATRQWATMVVFIVLLLGVMIVIQMIANKHNFRFDLTEEGEMTVAPITRKLLNEAEQPITVIGFYQPDERDKLESLLEMYRVASDRFTYELHNLDRNPGLANQYDINSYGSAVVEIGDKYRKIKYPSEESLINAIANLTNPESKKIYFLTGHGEYELEGIEHDCPCYGKAKQALETENLIVKEFLFAGGKAIPDDADVVLCGGPKVDFTAEELAMLDQYVRGEGALILALDPGRDLVQLQGFLEGYGISLGNGIVVDTQDYLIEKNPLVPYIPYYLAHPITEGFTIQSVFALARSVEKTEASAPEVTAKILARSGEHSWSETDIAAAERNEFNYDAGIDQRGPIAVAAVSEIDLSEPSDSEEDQQKDRTRNQKKGPEGKVVVFGDADFLMNFYFELMGNKDLFINTIHWMTESESLISIRRKEPTAEDLAPVYLGPMQARLIFIGIVIIQPIAVLALGLVVAWKRRRKG